MLELKMAKQEDGVGFIKQCCKRLLTYGVKEVIFEYDGSGDSGDLYGSTVVIAPTAAQIDSNLNETTCANQNSVAMASRDRQISWENFKSARQSEKNPAVTVQMCDEIEDEAFSLLPGGWEINDGSYGTITIYTVEERIEIGHNERYTDVRSETFNY